MDRGIFRSIIEHNLAKEKHTNYYIFIFQHFFIFCDSHCLSKSVGPKQMNTFIASFCLPYSSSNKTEKPFSLMGCAKTSNFFNL